MSNDFKNCRALGLEVECTLKAKTVPSHVVAAEALEVLLAKGVRVYGEAGHPAKFWNQNTEPGCGDTHTALLVDIQPIKRETAEDVLRAFVERWEAPVDGLSVEPLIERARRVLKK